MTVKKKYRKTFLGYSLYTEHWQYKLSSVNCTISSWKIMAKNNYHLPLLMLDFPCIYESPCKGRDSSCFCCDFFPYPCQLLENDPLIPQMEVTNRPWKGHKNGSKRGHDLKNLVYHPIWWFQPIWKLCSSNWIISSGIGMNIKRKNMWNHHLDILCTYCK